MVDELQATESREKPVTHTDRAIYDEIKQRARVMRRNPTPAEDMLWKRIRRKQVGGFRFRRQFAIERFIVDFYCFEARLVLEIDGAIHDEPGHAEYDNQRQQYLEALGMRVLRFTNAQVTNDAEAVVEFIRDWLSQNVACHAAQSGRQ